MSGHRAARGGAVLLIASVLGRGLSVGKGAILARLYLPEDHGSLAFGALLLGLFLAVAEAGVGRYVIAHDDESRALGGAFRFVTLSGLISVILVAAGGPVLARAVDEPGLVVVCAILSLSCLSLPLTIASSTFDRDFAFGRAKIPDYADIFLSTVVAASLAVLEVVEPAVALAIAMVAGTLGRAVLVWVLAPRRPRWRDGKGQLPEVLAFGAPLAFAAVAGYVAEAADDYFVRQFAGRADLGLYTIAFMLPQVLLSFVALTSRVLLPWMREHKEDREALARAFSETNHFIAIVAAPAGFGLAVAAPEVVAILYGDKWSDAVPLLTVFAVSFSLRASTGFNWSVLAILRGETATIGWISLATVAFAFLVGTPLIYYFGAIGGAYYNLAQLGVMMPIVRFPVILRALGTLRYLSVVWRPLVFSALGAAAYWVALLGLDRVDVPSVALGRFAVGAIAFATVYVASTFLLDPGARRLVRRARTLLRRA